MLLLTPGLRNTFMTDDFGDTMRKLQYLRDIKGLSMRYRMRHLFSVIQRKHMFVINHLQPTRIYRVLDSNLQLYANSIHLA